MPGRRNLRHFMPGRVTHAVLFGASPARRFVAEMGQITPDLTALLDSVCRGFLYRANSGHGRHGGGVAQLVRAAES